MTPKWSAGSVVLGFGDDFLDPNEAKAVFPNITCLYDWLLPLCSSLITKLQFGHFFVSVWNIIKDYSLQAASASKQNHNTFLLFVWYTNAICFHQSRGWLDCSSKSTWPQLIAAEGHPSSPWHSCSMQSYSYNAKYGSYLQRPCWSSILERLSSLVI